MLPERRSVLSNIRLAEKIPVGPLILEGQARVLLSLESLETLRMLVKLGDPKVVTITNFHSLFPVDVLSGKAE